MGIQVVPEWMAGLEEEDVAFLKNFLLCSGSLKEIAGLYGVTYPTVRLRLDRIIQGAAGGGVRRGPLCSPHQTLSPERKAGL